MVLEIKSTKLINKETGEVLMDITENTYKRIEEEIIKPIETDKDFSDDESVYMPSYATTKQKTSYDIVGEAVSKYWREEYFPCDVVAFFYQKYEHDNNWEWCEELVESHGDRDYENMTFLNDFCEGQTCVKDITIVPLWKVIEYYTQHVLKQR